MSNERRFEEKRKPPQWADRFLRWYCRHDLLEEIQGDIYELFYRRISTSKASADLNFVRNVLRFFRWKNIRSRYSESKSINPLAMFKSYIISGIRNILRNPVPSAINLIGLSVALACSITIFIILDSYYNLDAMHKKGERLFLLMNKVQTGDHVENWASSPYLLGPALKEQNSTIESFVRIQRTPGVSMRYNDQVFSDQAWFVDPDFFRVFSFTIKNGNPNALRKKDNIVITPVIAEKYFGTEDPIGKSMSLKFWSGEKKVFQVGAVMNAVPDNSSMYLQVLIPMENWEDLQVPATIDWKTWTSSTFILQLPGHPSSALNAGLDKLTETQHQANEKFQIKNIEWLPMPNVAERSYEIIGALSWSNIPAAMIAFGVIATLLISLACFNYMNVSIASVSSRLKEIGIRKVIGGGKKQIVQQFMIENLVMCAVALGVGTLLSWMFLIPGFNTLYPIHIDFGFSSSKMVFAFFGGSLLLVALLSGAYPALYVSSFNPVQILKGREKFGSKSLLSKTLLSFQFILSFTTIVGCLVFVKSSDYFENKDWGYSHAETLLVPVENQKQYEGLRDQLSVNKNVLNLSGSEGHVGFKNQNITIRLKEQDIKVARFGVGFNYAETIGLHFKEGRSFRQEVQSDHTESAIVNEAMVRKMSWKKPIGETFIMDSVKYFVIGVVSDFNYTEFYSAVEPAVFHIAPETTFRYVVVQARSGSANEMDGFLREVWRKIAPDDPYQGKFQDEAFGTFYRSTRANNKVLYFISAVTLLLTCMGLFGLISYNLTRRIKEFSIRKVFGASIFSIFKLMNGDYIWILSGSFIIGAPLGFYLIEKMLEQAYPEYIPVGAGPFAIAFSIMIVIVAITISSQLRRIIQSNPTETLRTD